MKDSTSQLRIATRRAKSDVANKLVSMFLHELSRKISEDWPIRVDSQEYEHLVRDKFNNRCPYCSCDLASTVSVKEHLDGMNRLRGGLHVPGNVVGNPSYLMTALNVRSIALRVDIGEVFGKTVRNERNGCQKT